MRRSKTNRLLSQLRADLANSKKTCPSSMIPPVTAAMVAIWLDVSENYIRDHEREEAHAWVPMESLLGAVEHCLESVQRSVNREGPLEWKVR